jgi:Holliday junction resolvase-like predicted endonuclease
MLDFVDLTKAQVTQGLAVAFFEHAGYRVTRLGVEERLGEIKQLDADAYSQLALPKQLRSLPDLIVTEPDLKSAHLVEVKYRRNLADPGVAELIRKLTEQFEFWPNTVVVLFLGESLWEGRGYIQDHLRAIQQRDLEKLSDTRHDLQWRVESLPLVHRVFQRLTSDVFHAHADRISRIIQKLAEM